MKTSHFVLIYLYCVLGISVYAQTMTLEEYREALESANYKSGQALPQIATLKTKIEQTKLEIEQIKKQSDDAWNDILHLVGITQEQYNNYADSLESLALTIQNYRNEYSDDLSAWTDALGASHNLFKVLSAHPAALIPRLEPDLQAIEQALADSRSALDAEKPETNPGSANIYIVKHNPQRRDCLWRIAARPEIYGSGTLWNRIFKANRDKISDPDLIFPGQRLTITR